MAPCRDMLPNFRLIHAIENGCTADFNAAIKDGATADAHDVNFKSALEVAMIRGQNDLARELIRLGADPNQAIGKRDDRLIHFAARRKNFGFVGLLLQSGVSPNSRGTLLRTPLHIAAKLGLEYMVRDLLEHGADVDARDVRGQTALDAAGVGGQRAIKDLLYAKVKQLELNGPANY